MWNAVLTTLQKVVRSRSEQDSKNLIFHKKAENVPLDSWKRVLQIQIFV